MAPAQKNPRLNEAEYLRIERAAEFRSEFFDGEMFALAGGTPEHGLIATNIAGELRAKLRGRLCCLQFGSPDQSGSFRLVHLP